MARTAAHRRLGAHPPSDGSSVSLGGVFTKTLHYLEQSVAHWVMSEQRAGVDDPLDRKRGDRSSAATCGSTTTPRRSTAWCCRAAPTSCRRRTARSRASPRGPATPMRDRYEIELFEAFVGKGKPVLGICRGCQLINVAFGGTLYQDIATQIPGALNHRDIAKYERNFHALKFVPGTQLAKLYPPRRRGDQHDPPPGGEQARSRADRRGAGRAGRHRRGDPLARSELRARRPVASGVHVRAGHRRRALDGTPILNEFLDAVRARKAKR